MESYKAVTGYQRYVDLKKLDLIVSFLTRNLEGTTEGLEAGCGEGNITIPLAYLGYQMRGIDISPQTIESALKQKAKFLGSDCLFPVFSVGDIASLTFAELSFDFVICSEVLEHLTNPEAAMSSLSGVLKKQGFLIITVPNGYGPYALLFDHLQNKVVTRLIRGAGHSGHQQTFSLRAIRKLLSASGFKILDFRHSDFLSFLPVLVKWRAFCLLDCKLADWLPHQMVSGWYLFCQKA